MMEQDKPKKRIGRLLTGAKPVEGARPYVPNLQVISHDLDKAYAEMTGIAGLKPLDMPPLPPGVIEDD